MIDLRVLFRPKYERSRAVVIGIDEYLHVPPLAYAVNDALAIAGLLKRDFGFQDTHISLLTNESATRDAIRKALGTLATAEVQVDDRVFVFFAGHGHTASGYRGDVGFLVPHDGRTDDLGSLIRWDELTRSAELIRAKHMLFVMDACYGGLALTRHAGPGSSRFVSDMLTRYSRQVLTAGKPDEVVADAGGPIAGHSVFTGHLIKALEGGASSSEGVLTAAGVMAYVYEKVAKDKNSNQTPHYGHFDGDGDFVFKDNTPAPSDAGEGVQLLVSIPAAFEPDEDNVGKIRTLKALLSNSRSSIEVHDFVTREVRNFLALTTDDYFPLAAAFSKEELFDRIGRYEEAVLGLAEVLACISHWGSLEQVAIVEKALARSGDRLEQKGGLNHWLALRFYPLVIELYLAGMACIAGRRYDVLARVFYAPSAIAANNNRNTHAFVHAVSDSMAEMFDVFKQLPGLEKKHVPLSEHLFKLIQPSLDDLFFLGKGYEDLFDEFEILLALVVCDLNVLTEQSSWGPPGRFGWKGRHVGTSPFNRLTKEAEVAGANWPPLKAGLFGGSLDRANRAIAEFRELLKNLRY